MYEQILTTTAITSLAILGSCIGSFINVAALRHATNTNYLTGRSLCPACNRTLEWYDLIPVISWLTLLGRCRSCKTCIPPRYVLVEITAALAFAICFVAYGFTWATLLAITSTIILLAISLIDLDTMEIPDGLVIALIPLAIAAIFIQPEISIISRGIGFFAISLPMLAIAIVINGAFGGGDIKLIAVCGFLLGWQNTLLAFFIALLLGGGWAIYLMASGKRKRGEHMVFGPALCVGILLALLYGQEIINWYWGLLVF